jgi:hypothetical protein
MPAVCLTCRAHHLNVQGTEMCCITQTEPVESVVLGLAVVQAQNIEGHTFVRLVSFSVS